MTTRSQPRPVLPPSAPQGLIGPWCDATGETRKSRVTNAAEGKPAKTRHPPNTAPTQHSYQRGVIAIEFAAVFIILLVIFYGTVGYFFPLFLSAGYQEIASEALRQAINDRHYSSYPDLEASEKDTYLAERRAVAHQAVENSWLREAWRNTCDGYGGSYFTISEINGEQVWKTCVRLDDPSDKLMPTLKIFNLEVPQLPTEIRGEAQIRADIL